MSEVIDFLTLRDALEASCDEKTAYLGVQQFQRTNPLLGSCYPISRVLQTYYPKLEIVKGIVWTGKSEETHFWNVLHTGSTFYHIDLSWQQFPYGSKVKKWEILDRHILGDSEATVARCELLRHRVAKFLANK